MHAAMQPRAITRQRCPMHFAVAATSSVQEFLRRSETHLRKRPLLFSTNEQLRVGGRSYALKRNDVKSGTCSSSGLDAKVGYMMR
jgi:hypothetical protein